MKTTLPPETINLQKENTALKRQVLQLRKDLERANFRTREAKRELIRLAAEKDMLQRQQNVLQRRQEMLQRQQKL